MRSEPATPVADRQPEPRSTPRVMRLRVDAARRNLSPATRDLVRRMLHPLCGLDQRITFLLHSHHEPRVIIAGAELAGVHWLVGGAPPRNGGYHIGGAGLMLEEVLLRTLGETLERYAQLLAERSGRHPSRLMTHADLCASSRRTVPATSLRFFTDAQFARPGFPFKPYRPEMPLGWLEASSLVHGSSVWVPSQLVMVGYAPKHERGEHRILPAVTTGTAAHTRPAHALRNALLELIQIDAAMGHWYSSATAPEIVLDQRASVIATIIDRHFDRHVQRPRFYWLPTPDLPGFSVACVLRQDSSNLPSAAVGLGADMRLTGALYKALIEAVAVAQLAKVTLFDHAIDPSTSTATLDPRGMFDLDSNVAFYALPANRSLIDRKFGNGQRVGASGLPPDHATSIEHEIEELVDGFRTSDKELVCLDLTTDDLRALGFTALRVWSPDTISLCLPSAPPAAHARFGVYGGVSHDNPHPYP